MENNQFPREIALCLSGGAARGAYQLGVISVLEENNIQIKAISGTSIGALIGASVACGKSAKEIFEVIKSKEFRSVFKYRFFKSYVFELNHSAEVINKIIDITAFSELCIALNVCVCDVVKESALYVDDSDDLKEIVLASCSIAPLFKPVVYKGKTLVDGGIVDNFPVEQLQKYGLPIIGVNLYPKMKHVPSSLFSWLKWVVRTAWQSRYHQKEKLCDFYVSNEQLNSVKVFSFKDLDRAYSLGKVDMQHLIDEYKNS